MMIKFNQKRNSNRFRRFNLLHFCAALVYTCVITPVTATTLIASNLAKMSETAEAAFIVRIDSFETSHSADSQAFDVVTGTVVEPVFGNVKTSETVTWNQFKFGRNVPLPAMPEYEPGREYLVFLSGKGTGPGFKAPIGLGQGVFAIVRNPQTGAAIARNVYMNSTLTAGLDVERAADAIAARQSRARGHGPVQQKAEAARLKSQLRSRGSGISLDALKQAARFFNAEKQRGAKPSQEYKTTAPARMLH